MVTDTRLETSDFAGITVALDGTDRLDAHRVGWNVRAPVRAAGLLHDRAPPPGTRFARHPAPRPIDRCRRRQASRSRCAFHRTMSWSPACATACRWTSSAIRSSGFSSWIRRPARRWRTRRRCSRACPSGRTASRCIDSMSVVRCQSRRGRRLPGVWPSRRRDRAHRGGSRYRDPVDGDGSSARRRNRVARGPRGEETLGFDPSLHFAPIRSSDQWQMQLRTSQRITGSGRSLG